MVLCLFGLVLGCASHQPLIKKVEGPSSLEGVMGEIQLLGRKDRETVEYRVSELLKARDVIQKEETLDLILHTAKEDRALSLIKEQFLNSESFFYRELGLSIQSRDDLIQKIDIELAKEKTYRDVASDKKEGHTTLREKRRPIGGAPMFY